MPLDYGPYLGVPMTTEGSYILLERPKTRGIPETMVCRILVYSIPFLYTLCHVPYDPQRFDTIFKILYHIHIVYSICHIVYSMPVLWAPSFRGP